MVRIEIDNEAKALGAFASIMQAPLNKDTAHMSQKAHVQRE